MATQTQKLLIYLILPLGLLLAAVVVASYQTRPDNKLHVQRYDFGSTLIQTYQGNQVLIDGGPDDRILAALGKSLPFYDHQIDLLILTKADEFHATGLVYILKRYEVRQILLPEGNFSSAAAGELLSLIDQKKINKTYLASNPKIMLDSGTLLDLPGRQIRFGQTQIQLGSESGEVVSDGSNLDKK